MANRVIRERAWMAGVKTIVLAALMVALTTFTAWKIMGPWSILLAGLFLIFTLRSLERSSLPARLRNAREIGWQEAPELYDLVAALSARAGLSRVPRLFLFASPTPNAAAVGNRNDASILVSPGLVRGLSEAELAGVLGHEISHIRNNDLGLFRFTETVRALAELTSRAGWLLLLLSLPISLVGAASVPIGTLFLFVAAPAAAMLLQLAILRSREFAADLGAVELTGDPRGLASALGKIEITNRWVLRQLVPVGLSEGPEVMRTHPATTERVRRLRELAFATS